MVACSTVGADGDAVVAPRVTRKLSSDARAVAPAGHRVRQGKRPEQVPLIGRRELLPGPQSLSR
jgi:hypothetical protein